MVSKEYGIYSAIHGKCKELEPVFEDFFMALQRGKHLEQYRFQENYYLISMDGTGYFSSDKISCPACLRKESKKGKVRYEHQIVSHFRIDKN